MTLVVNADLFNDLFFGLIIHFTDKIIIKTHGSFFETHIFESVEKSFLGDLQIFSINVERIRLPVQWRVDQARTSVRQIPRRLQGECVP